MAQNLAQVLFSISPQNQQSSDSGEHNLYNGESERFVQGSFKYGPNNNGVRGGLVISSPFEGVLIETGGLFERGRACLI